jgi:hypothetical protein
VTKTLILRFFKREVFGTAQWWNLVIVSRKIPGLLLEGLLIGFEAFLTSILNSFLAVSRMNAGLFSDVSETVTSIISD